MFTKKIKKVAFLSTYPPRECGLATFTEDLVNEIDKLPFIQPCVIAVIDKEKHMDFQNSQVKRTLIQHYHASYLLAALWANDNVDLLVIEHEYGIFGGECGEYIVDLAKNLKIPFIVTTHTVLLDPLPQQRSVLRDLGKLSAKVVTMAESSIPILTETYGIDLEKIVFIPHGVPHMNVKSREKLKADYGLHNKEVISSFGLISPAKGLEHGIEAVAKLVADYKNINIIYLILGKTHPCIQESMGEKYRHGLMDLARSLGVEDNIRFVDKYLTKAEVITYLRLSDIYLTPYLSKEQAVSGTLAYAVGCGRVIVSTPYRYAEEMLGGGRGMLAKFGDSGSIATCIRTVLTNSVRKKEMEMKTLAVGQTMTWSKVAAQYAALGTNIINDMESIKNPANYDTRRFAHSSVPKAHSQLALVSRNEMKVSK